MSNRGWIGVDLDGTLAQYDSWIDVSHVGEPIPKMLSRVKDWLAYGADVRIFTARVWPLGTIWQDVEQPKIQKRVAEAIVAKKAIEAWCEKHLGKVLEITCCKDYSMVEIWDDRAIQIEKNTGRRMDGCE